MVIQRLLLFAFLLITLSCSSSKNLVYFNNINESGQYQAPIEKAADPRVQPDDLLAISVSSLNPESNMLFNNGVLTTVGSTNQALPTRTNEGYLVDKNGNINFPVIGTIALGGLTKAEATSKMTDAIKAYIKNPIINIRFLNFKITVLGEVNRPSSFNILTERVNVLEALGLAGDMTPYGRRDNVLIIREKDGVRSTTRLNLMDKSTLSSPAFYLQQNDILYIEPSSSRALQASSRAYYLPIVLTAISVVSVLIATFTR
jgi:polysaccharide export outer membrane protein